eukprot:1347607-Amorphochlora_amoeboformis.AAC.1
MSRGQRKNIRLFFPDEQEVFHLNLVSRISNLESRISDLESRISDLESGISNLETPIGTWIWECPNL